MLKLEGKRYIVACNTGDAFDRRIVVKDKSFADPVQGVMVYHLGEDTSEADTTRRATEIAERLEGVQSE